MSIRRFVHRHRLCIPGCKSSQCQGITYLKKHIVGGAFVKVGKRHDCSCRQKQSFSRAVKASGHSMQLHWSISAAQHLHALGQFSCTWSIQLHLVNSAVRVQSNTFYKQMYYSCEPKPAENDPVIELQMPCGACMSCTTRLSTEMKGTKATLSAI